MARTRKSDPEIVAQVQQAADLVAYQEGSVVSRTIVDKDTGTVTVFAFGKGEGLSEHTAPFDALVHVIDGKAEITISGKAHHLAAGDMILMPANEPHALDATQPFKMVLTMIRK
jgi:quercetin dioxygenase-like cupin family protein